MGKEALVVKRDVLFREKHFHGFLPKAEHDYLSLILRHHSYHPRGDELENNEALRQIIPYVWIVNPQEKTVFLYKRAPNGNGNKEYKETRYLNKYAGGVGGHIDRDTEEAAQDPVHHAMLRELQEEVEMARYPVPSIVGYLNDEGDSLGRVHFGIAAIAETREGVICRKSEGLSSGAFYSAEEVDRIFGDSKNQVEGWTRLSWPFVKQYISSL